MLKKGQAFLLLLLEAPSTVQDPEQVLNKWKIFSIADSSLSLPCGSSINAKLRLDRQNDPLTCPPGLNIT